ncbi:MAG: polysaccharide biosynthesis tyrosine autokinase [Alphaproteobacteria bacterium]|nr:MAG: polysaccharide biosynthesis tyrosine autokinase [Alphaproteobacteria bacterium]
MQPAMDRGAQSGRTAELTDGRGNEGDALDTDSSMAVIDVRQVWSAFYRNRFIVLGVMAFALMAGLAVSLLTTPVFESTATVQIEQQTPTILQDSEVDPISPVADTERFLQTQGTILRSRSLAHRVAQSLNLYRDDEFVIAMGGKPLQLTGRQLAAARQDQVIGLLLNNLEIAMPRQSRVATITFSSPSSALAARVANSYGDNYIRSNLERRVDSSAYARRFLQTQIGDTRERLEDSEQNLLAYAREAGLIDAGGVSTSPGGQTPALTLSASNLQDINSAYARTRAARIEAEERWRAAQSAPLMSLSEVISSPAILPLMQLRANHVATLGELRARYQADHPTVVQLASQIANIDREIKAQATKIRSNIQNAFIVLRNQERALDKNVEDLRTLTLNEQGRRVRYNILKREVDTNRTLYDALLQRFKELAATAGASTSNVSIVDAAEPPARPSKPNIPLNLALALLTGLSISVLATFLRERFDDVIRNPDEVAAKLGIRLLGVVPVIPKRSSPAEELRSQLSPMSEAYLSLRTSLAFSTPKGAPQVLLVTSSRPAEGKSTSAVALAQSFGRLDKKVLLIDCDLRRPSLHKQLNLSSNIGLVDLLTGRRTLEEVTQTTEMLGVDFIACGSLPPNPTDLLSSEVLHNFIAQARTAYGVVIIDGPPVIGLADAPILAQQADAVSFVIETGLAHRGQAKAAIRRLSAVKANIVGAILTKFDARRSGYGYAYGYGYDYGSRKDDTV